MTGPLKLTVVLTHPIQYYAPWFRHIQANEPAIDLTVLYATEPTPAQQGVGFGRAFAWDVPLTDGYRSIIVRPPQPDDRVDSEHFLGLNVPQISRAIAETSPDVAMIGGWYSITLVRALFACRRMGIPTLYRGDSHLLSGPTGWKRPLWALKTRALIRQFDGFLSPGFRATEHLKWHGAPDHRIFQVPHAVDNEMFAAAATPYRQPETRAAARQALGIAPDAFVVLFVGKLMRSKRPANVVRAMASLDPGATLIVAGDGPLAEEVRAAAVAHGVDLRMTGFRNQSELGELYGIADCLTLPSTFPETWGLVVNEALATGLPCIVSTAVGCAPDLIRDDETGYVYPLDDQEALTAALQRIRSRKAQGHDWGPACREQVTRYRYNEMTVGLVHACRSVLSRSRGADPVWPKVHRRVIACCGQMVIAGGLERMTFEVLNVLRNDDTATHAIVNGWENFRITPLAEASGASWSVGPYWHALTRRRLTPIVIAKMLIEISRVSLDLLRVSRQIHPTHIFVPDFEVVIRNAPALFWLRLRGAKVIMRLGNAPEPERFYQLLWRHVIDRFVDCFVANSAFTRRQLIAHGIRPAKTLTIPNMTRRTLGTVGTRRIPGRLIFVGQIIPEKGLDVLMDAVALVRGRGIAATLDVVGDIDGWESPSYRGYRAAIREQAGRRELEGAVNLLGWHEDVPELLSQAALHCCPSQPQQRESFGNVVLEAKVSGLPSVVTQSGGLAELVTHRVDGWICSDTTAAAIAEGIEYFFSQPERLAAAGQAALASAALYSEERFATSWNQVFRIEPNG